MAYCIVEGCWKQRVTGGSINLFSLPKDQSLNKKWRNNLNLGDKILTRPMKVCNKHFQQELIGSKKLKRGAIPTLHLGREIIHVPILVPYKKKITSRYCCISHCPNHKDKKDMLFSFPINENEKLKWKLACNLDANTKKKLYICKKHFSINYVMQNKLLKGGFPKFNLDAPKLKEVENIEKNSTNDPHKFPVINVNALKLKEVEDIKTNSEDELHVLKVTKTYSKNTVKLNESKKVSKTEEMKIEFPNLTYKEEDTSNKNTICTNNCKEKYLKNVQSFQEMYSRKEKEIELLNEKIKLLEEYVEILKKMQ